MASRPGRIGHGRFGFARDGENLVGADLRVEGGALQEVGRTQVGRRATCDGANRAALRRSKAGVFGLVELPVECFLRAQPAAAFLAALETKLLRAGEDDAGRCPRGKGLRHLIANGYADGRIGACATAVEVAAEPAFALGAIGVGRRLPDFGRAKMRPVRIGIAHALDDGEMAVVEERFEAGQIRIEASVGIEPEDLFGRQGEPGPGAMISVVGEGHDHVEAVVAACQLDDHKDGAVLAGGGLDERVGRHGVEGTESFREENRQRPGSGRAEQ